MFPVDFAASLLSVVAPGGAHRHEQVIPDTEEWRTLASAELLQKWIYIASRDSLISKVYGTSLRPYDRPYFNLEAEALVFLNALLRTLQPFNLAAAARHASALWKDIQSGDEAYEAGALVNMVVFQAGSDVYPVGDRLVLHRIAGDWAGQRFDRAQDIPSDTWAVVAQVERKRDAFAVVQGLRDIEIANAEKTLFEDGLLPIRIAAPDVYWVSSTYRIPGSGSWWPARRGVHASWWKDERLEEERKTLTPQQVQDLLSIGEILSRHAPLLHPPPRLRESSYAPVALRAFNSSLTRRDWQDRIIDIAVCLEALFSHSKEDVTHKAATRTALLLGKDPAESERIYRTVKQLYNLRSLVVHGEGADLQKLVLSAKSVLTKWQIQQKNAGKESNTQKPDPDPRTVRKYGHAAASTGVAVAASAIKAFLRLHDQGKYRPFSKVFPEDLDLWAFDSNRRRAMQTDSGVLPGPSE